MLSLLAWLGQQHIAVVSGGREGDNLGTILSVMKVPVKSTEPGKPKKYTAGSGVDQMVASPMTILFLLVLVLVNY